MSSWSIRIPRKYSPISLVTEKISLEEWQNYVENDNELIWEENSQISLSFIEAGKEWIKPEHYRKQAYFDIRKKDNWPGLRLSYFEGTIAGTTERQTLRRV